MCVSVCLNGRAMLCVSVNRGLTIVWGCVKEGRKEGLGVYVCVRVECGVSVYMNWEWDSGSSRAQVGGQMWDWEVRGWAARSPRAY